MIASSDSQSLYARTAQGSQTRSIEIHQFAADETTFTLPDLLTGITFGAVTASWITLPRYDYADLYADQRAGNHYTSQQVVASKAWLDTMHATTVTFDVQPPGFQTAWTLDPSTGYGELFGVDYRAGSVDYATSLSDGTGTAVQPANRPMFSTVERLHEPMRSLRPMD